MPSPQIKYPAAVFGYSADTPIAPALVDYMVASTAVAVRDVVIIDTTTLGNVKPAATTSATNLVVGVATEAAAAGEILQVVIAGRATARVNTNVTSGDRLGLDGTTAANLATVTAATAVTQAKDLGMVVAVAEQSVTTNAATDCIVRIVKF